MVDAEMRCGVGGGGGKGWTGTGINEPCLSSHHLRSRKSIKTGTYASLRRVSGGKKCSRAEFQEGL